MDNLTNVLQNEINQIAIESSGTVSTRSITAANDADDVVGDNKVKARTEQNLRSLIFGIQHDSSLSAKEKARRIQLVMMGKFGENHHNHCNNSLSCCQTSTNPSSRSTSPIHAVDHDDEFNATNIKQQPNDANHNAVTVSYVSSSPENTSSITMTREEAAKTYHDSEKTILGCKHYMRGSKIQAACCGRWYTCRLCHDEQESTHQINRHDTKSMLCQHCLTAQPVARDCINCGTMLGSTHYCDICKFWDSNPDRSIYHCDKCGLCRVGRGLGIDYFHCDKCGVCLSMTLKDKHRCIERNLESDCPICGDYLFTSTHTVIFMPCSHAIHYNCYQEHITNSYQCPICWKSLADMTSYFKQIDRMLEEHKMPVEYENFYSVCLCNDCEQKSKTKYHFLYHKCQSCGSYNTKILQTLQELSVNTTNLGVGGSGTDINMVARIDTSVSSSGTLASGEGGYSSATMRSASSGGMSSIHTLTPIGGFSLVDMDDVNGDDSMRPRATSRVSSIATPEIPDDNETERSRQSPL